MKILNFGSLNLDYVYQMPHFVRAGETLSSTGYQVNAGGKGLNQSVALARAGARVWHAGQIGAEGERLRALLAENGVDTHLVRTVPGATGHAIIQVEPKGNNCILLYGGANHCVSDAFIEAAMAEFGPDDLLILQNEINALDRVIEAAAARGMQIVLNPSPVAENLSSLPLDKISWFILNEVEGEALSGEHDIEKMPAGLLNRFPGAKIVLTLGQRGSVYMDGATTVRQAADTVHAVDTTAAGDSFTGFFFAAIAEGQGVPAALRRASRAAAISVTRPGAANSIPLLDEVLESLKGE